jgi:hypothetical protein
MNVHWEKSTNEREGKPEQKTDVAFGTWNWPVFSKKQAETREAG